jgi:hypothetical protein
MDPRIGAALLICVGIIALSVFQYVMTIEMQKHTSDLQMIPYTQWMFVKDGEFYKVGREVYWGSLLIGVGGIVSGLAYYYMLSTPTAFPIPSRYY